MKDISIWMEELKEKLLAHFGGRLRYLGLQGSFGRGEATPKSDIDVMTAVENLSIADLDAYRDIVATMEESGRACGFICGLEELQNWPRYELFQVMADTRDVYGELKAILPAFSDEDVRDFVRINAANLYHELTHRYLYEDRERNIKALPFCYKGSFYILMNLHYLRTGEVLSTKKALLGQLSGDDQVVLETAMGETPATEENFDEKFALLLRWCRRLLREMREEG